MIREKPVPALKQRSYPANQFLFQLDDDRPEAGLLRSVSGGSVKGAIVEEGVGNDLHHIKHVGVIEIEPIKLELGMALSRPFLTWIEDSWSYKFSRRNGAIIHADFDYRERASQWFYNGLITETRFPTLDGSSKDPAYLEVTLLPEKMEIKQGDGKRIGGTVSASQKKWLASSFSLDIDGVDCSHVNKIDSFSVTQGTRQLYTGESRYPEIEPTKITFANLTLYMALDHAGDFIKWHREYVVDGQNENQAEKNGRLEFLGPDANEVLFAIDLQNLGICALSIDDSKAEKQDIKRCKVELYVESMKLDYGSGID
jgi:hypothetical protein